MKPREIQLFLVGRRRRQQQQSEEQIELTKLEGQISLHLNLAQLDVSRQLQLACMARGSIPAANIRWNQIRPTMVNIYDHEPSKQLRPSASLDDSELMKAVRSLNFSSERSAEGDHDGDNESQQIQQWSFVKVQDINIHEHHKAVIECSAYNEKYHKRVLSASSSDAASEKTASDIRASVVLNITHQPILSVELELKASANELEASTSATNSVAIGGGADITLPRDSQSKQVDTVIAAVYGQELDFVCRVNFANPPIIGQQPIQWLFNDTMLDKYQPALENRQDTTTKLSTSLGVELISRHLIEPTPDQGLPDGYLAEKITVRIQRLTDIKIGKIATIYGEQLNGFRNDNDHANVVRTASVATADFAGSLEPMSAANTGQEWLLVKCGGRNVLGQGMSNEVRVVIGRSPSCLDSASNLNGNEQWRQQQQLYKHALANYSAADKMNIQAHCPVMSDKTSSRYYWNWLWHNESSLKADDMARAAPPNVELFFNKGNTSMYGGTTQTSESDRIVLANLIGFDDQLNAGKQHPYIDKILDKNGQFGDGKVTIICYARDKFGSNDNNPCVLTESNLLWLEKISGELKESGISLMMIS